MTDLMMDTDIVAASPGSVYRVLREAGALRRWEAKPSKKGKGFVPPQSAHAHWHIDVSYLLATLTGSIRSRSRPGERPVSLRRTGPVEVSLSLSTRARQCLQVSAHSHQSLACR